MTRERASLLRLVLVCAAWALGQTVAAGLRLGGLGFVLPAALAVATYVLTEELGRPRGGTERYWRGRRIDDDRRRGRWN